ncbi:MAG: hypothetical protein RSD95_13965 [Clostridia bacterium]
MFGVVIITFVITALAIFVLVLVDSAKKRNRETDHLRRSNERLNDQIADMIRQENARRACAAYDKGLYDGRATDTFYRKMLKRYTSGNQATVMMCGEDEMMGRK